MVAAGSITVAVRVRPPSSWEAARLPEPVYDATIRGDGALSTPAKVANSSCLRDIVQIVDDRILTFDPDEKDRARSFMERGFLPPGTKRYKDRRFMFDRVFGREARQQDVYEATAQPLLGNLLDGFNATVFAYGATGCGKTHTISGADSDPGIIYLTMADLFQRIDDRREDYDVEVMVTFLEIYNEEIRDLLAESGSHAPRGGLSIREDKTVKVVGLAELKPRTAEEVKEIVILGNTRRTQSPTHANETSSRSHAVLQVHVTQAPRTAGLTEQRTMATLSIIDLAGSERAAATSNMGQRMVEGANINKSLLALGNCINALCESGGSVRHIPYRNSKLTRLLKFSLGGNCKTVMIVCVAPTSAHFDDTHNTLIYAERATKIKTKVVTRNVVNVDRHVGRYVEAINRLNIEIQELKDKLAGKRAGEQEVQARRRAESKAEVDRSRTDLQAKMEHTQPSITDGATCSGKLNVAKVKLAAIQGRLAEIAGEGRTPTSEAERALLGALAGPEEDALKPGSALTVRLQRSSNANAMFDATMKAASERKSEKLDEFGSEMIKLEASYRRAAIDRLRAESERDAMQEAVGDMADVMVKLVGLLGRCTVLVGEAANALNAPEKPEEDMSSRAKKVASGLENLKQKNDDAFKTLLGHSVESYIVQNVADTSLYSNFGNYGTNFGRRISSGPAILQQTSKSSTRRNSTVGSVSISASPPRRHRTPRKSLRSGLAPYRRAEEKKPAKSVQWRDEAGQGKLDDADKSMVSSSGPVLQVTPASPANVDPFQSTESPAPRCTSALGSESDWEDETERMDDSVQVSFLSGASSSSQSASTSTRPPGRRQRPSRLDLTFLKPKSRGSTLGSLKEADESSPERRPRPLSDRSLNRMESNEDSTGSSENGLRVSKARDWSGSSPNKRGPSGKMSLSASTSGKPSSRRRSNIGPLRNEKGRRRSSLIPQLSPPQSGDGGPGGPRRVFVNTAASPLKRVKRSSLSKSTTGYKHRPGSSFGVANLSVMFEGNSSMDLSTAKGSRPTWR